MTYTMTQEHKDKLAASNKGQKRSLQTRKNIAEAGRNRPPMTEVTKEKLRVINTGKKMSAEAIEKTRQFNLGRKLPRDQVERQAAATRGQKRTTAQKKVLSLSHITHGMAGKNGDNTGRTRHPAYSCYHSMKQRCGNPNNKGYKAYGAKGIHVCARWLESFENFWEDMGPTWYEGASIDRIYSNRGYSLENCQWLTLAENSAKPSVYATETPEDIRIMGLMTPRRKP